MEPKQKHWRMTAEDKQQWRLACWHANKRRCPLCQQPVKFEHTVSDHCHTYGTTRAVLCTRCNGALILGAVEGGKLDEEIIRMNQNPGRLGRPWPRGFVLDVLTRARAYAAAWRTVTPAHQRWRHEWSIGERHTAGTTPNRFVLAVWLAHVATLLKRHPAIGPALGLGDDPEHMLRLAGSARYRDNAAEIRITQLPNGMLRLTAPSRIGTSKMDQ